MKNFLLQFEKAMNKQFLKKANLINKENKI